MEMATEAELQRAEFLSIDRDEFLARFKARLIRLVGGKTDEDVSAYADDIGPTYWDNHDQRQDGPEECAAADASEWGQE
jgi:hypothetical protein